MSSPQPRPEQQGNDRRLFIWLFLIAGTFLLIYSARALFSSETGLYALFHYQFAKRDLMSEKKSLEKHVLDEKKEVRDLRLDPFALEKVARERQHRVRNGEILVLPNSQNLLSRE
ncbi:MAG: FtsB family cell division protein [Leptospirillum sp.]|jgi:cell division protein FtsB